MKILLAVVVALSVSNSVWALTCPQGQVVKPGVADATVEAEKVDHCIDKPAEKTSTNTDVCKQNYGAGGVATQKAGEGAAAAPAGQEGSGKHQ